MAANPFTYSRAIVCGIPDSLPAAALRMDSGGEPVDLEKARQQHEEYLQVVEKWIDTFSLVTVTVVCN